MSDNSEAYGVGGRLKTPPDPLLINSAYKHDNSYADTLMPHLHNVDLAYCAMLSKQQIIPKKERATLLKALIEIKDVDHNTYLNPDSGDIYNSKESYLKKKIGNVSGWVHIGRPRREAINAAFLLAVRERYINYVNALVDLAESFINKAKSEIKTIIPDYTYLYQSTPTTFGHYLLTFLFPLLRDLDRSLNTYDKINQCPIGCGVSNGSNLNIDRKLVSHLLCFDRPILHSRDGMWQPDIPMNIASDISMAFMNLSRLADELQIFNSVEFSMVELPDSLCRTSVIMPQKKNPYPLTYIRGLANSYAGKLMSALSYGKVYSGNPDSRVFAYVDIPEMLDTSVGGVQLLTKVISTLSINKEQARKNLSKGFTFASELSEYLSTQFKIDYKTSHDIVGTMIRQLINQELNAISAESLNKIIQQKTGTDIQVEESELQNIINPETILSSRKTDGSAGIVQMEEMLKIAKEQIDLFKDKANKIKASINYEDLYSEINQIINS